MYASKQKPYKLAQSKPKAHTHLESKPQTALIPISPAKPQNQKLKGTVSLKEKSNSNTIYSTVASIAIDLGLEDNSSTHQTASVDKLPRKPPDINSLAASTYHEYARATEHNVALQSETVARTRDRSNSPNPHSPVDGGVRNDDQNQRCVTRRYGQPRCGEEVILAEGEDHQ
ncbi:hypothetical protein RHMOL_Rhmol04G0234200 [Rhododendron molle]|uniref:Uncharacterized protein n=1 Tax=Rhododendron molle TaxID=49168 RepID=A0ACC0P621_RHOML|nr:hypothetical protein RHMOL_Rhmol04G0234200 [Rhododendron molle]